MKSTGTTTLVANAVALAVVALAPCAMAANGKGVAYVSNQKDGVTVIALDTLTPVGNIDIGGKEPRGVGITGDGKYLLTANKDDGDISVIDTATLKAIKHIPIGKNPEFVRVRGDRAYVSYEPSAGEGKPDAKPDEKKDAKKDGKDDDDNNKAPAGIAVIDLKEWKVIKTMISGPETEGIEFSPDGKMMLVTNEGDNTITVYDTASTKLLRTIKTDSYGNRPRGIKVSPDGKLYAVTLEFSAKLLLLDSNLKVVKTLSTGKSPYGVAFDSKGERLFVSASGDKELQVFDTKSFALIKNVPVGGRCWHFTFTPDNTQIVMACGKSNDLYVIDATTYQPVKVISGLQTPWGVVTWPKALGSLDQP